MGPPKFVFLAVPRLRSSPRFEPQACFRLFSRLFICFFFLSSLKIGMMLHYSVLNDRPFFFSNVTFPIFRQMWILTKQPTVTITSMDTYINHFEKLSMTYILIQSYLQHLILTFSSLLLFESSIVGAEARISSGALLRLVSLCHMVLFSSAV